MTAAFTTLADRIGYAEYLAHRGDTIDVIARTCGIAHETAAAIYGRCTPHAQDPFTHAGLKRCCLTEAQHAQRLANMR